MAKPFQCSSYDTQITDTESEKLFSLEMLSETEGMSHEESNATDSGQLIPNTCDSFTEPDPMSKILGFPIRRNSTSNFRQVGTSSMVRKERSINQCEFKELLLDQKNTTKIRPILLSFNGLSGSEDKIAALNHLLERYVDKNKINPMTKVSKQMLEARGIKYYELVVAGFSLRNISVAEVSKESSCAFGILSAFKQNLLLKDQSPVFNKNDEAPEKLFKDPSLEKHIEKVFKYLSKDNHLSIKSQFDTLLQDLPEGIALVNVWDIDINEKVQHFLQSLRGHLYNMHSWLVMDVLKDEKYFEKPPEVPRESTSELTQIRSRIDYQLRSAKMCESQRRTRKEAIAIFGKYSEKDITEEQLDKKITRLETKIKQKARHMGIASLIDPIIHLINLNGQGITKDSSFHLYWKFLQLVYDTPYVEVPISWVFLRSLFYDNDKQYITKEDLLARAKECGMNRECVDEFCAFYTSFGSIFDISLVNSSYKYVIVKPIGFLRLLHTLLSPSDELVQKYPSLQFGVVSEMVLKEIFNDNWNVFIYALVSLNLATQIGHSCLEISDLHLDTSYFFVPLCRRFHDDHNTVNPDAVHLITTIDSPHFHKQAFFIWYLLESSKSFSKPKLVNCKDSIKVAVKDVNTETTITMVSSNPITQISVNHPSVELCFDIMNALHEASLNCYSSSKEATIKYKYVVLCTKNSPQLLVSSMLSKGRYHILPYDELCEECKRNGRDYRAWNEAFKKIQDKYIFCKPEGETIKPSELTYVAEKLSSLSCDLNVFVEVFNNSKAANTLNWDKLHKDKDKNKIFCQLLFQWDSAFTDDEPRRSLARKIIKIGAKIGNKDQWRYFEDLAKDIDANAPSIEEFSECDD